MSKLKQIHNLAKLFEVCQYVCARVKMGFAAHILVACVGAVIEQRNTSKSKKIRIAQKPTSKNSWYVYV